MADSTDSSSSPSRSSVGDLEQAAFPLGQLVATPGSLQLLELHGISVFELLRRHVSGTDWGDVCASDRKANDDALLHGDRILSMYTLVKGDPGTRLFVITEWNRSVTTVLKSSEY